MIKICKKGDLEVDLGVTHFIDAWEGGPPLIKKGECKMRNVAVGAMLAALIAAPAMALTVSEVDTDADGLISYAEMAVTYPALTEEIFAEVDTSEDGFVDETELTAALEAGMIEEPAE